MAKIKLPEIKTIKDLPHKEEFFKGGASTCAGCPAVIGIKLILKALGKNTVVVNSAGCMTLLSVLPRTPMNGVGWIFNAIENVAPTAAAIKQMNPELNLVCYAGDGATYDIGFQSMSHVLEKGKPIIYVCYNNELYANTGAQWCPATPFGAATKTTPRGKKLKTGNPVHRKEIEKIIAQQHVYVATASVAYPLDLIQKVQKIAQSGRPGFLNLLVPCVPGWGIDPEITVEQSRLAVETGFWPLYEISEEGVLTLNFKPEKLKPLEEFINHQHRYKKIPLNDLKKLKQLIQSKWQELLAFEGKKCIGAEL